MTTGLGGVIAFLVALGLAYAAALALAGTAILTLRSLGVDLAVFELPFGAAVAVVGLGVAYLLRSTLLDATGRSVRWAEGFGSARWLWIVISLGLVLRVAWVAIFPAAPVSDGEVYLGLAHRMLYGEGYEVAGRKAYWPPGYPLFLLPWLFVFESDALAILLSNLVLFVVGCLGVFKLAREFSGEAGARFAVAIFALWPTYLFMVGLPEKEQVLIALLPWVLWLGASPVAAPPNTLRCLAGGALLGGCVLIQPALQLFPMLFVAYYLARGFPVLRSALSLGAIVLGLVLVVLPWTIRNFLVLSAFVFVSTNGGDGLYRANNPLATGGYIEQGEVDIFQYPEVEGDRVGRGLAREWLLSNPDAALRLALEKNLRFMGDDSFGAFHSLKREQTAERQRIYLPFKALCNAFWLAYWLVAAAALFQLVRQRRGLGAGSVLMGLAFLYPLAIHSIAESNGKYHVLMTGVLATLLVTLASRANASWMTDCSSESESTNTPRGSHAPTA